VKDFITRLAVCVQPGQPSFHRPFRSCQRMHFMDPRRDEPQGIGLGMDCFEVGLIASAGRSLRPQTGEFNSPLRRVGDVTVLIRASFLR
jgi:hypothetical protein